MAEGWCRWALQPSNLHPKLRRLRPRGWQTTRGLPTKQPIDSDSQARKKMKEQTRQEHTETPKKKERTNYRNIEAQEFPTVEKLNSVKRLRLLFNTEQGLSSYTKMELRNNSFTKKTSYIAKCIWADFVREVKERVPLDLGALLSDYQQASRYYDRLSNARRSPQRLEQLTRVLLDPAYARGEGAGLFTPRELERARKVDLSLVILLCLGVIPTFTSRSGDVTTEALKVKMQELREFFSRLYDYSPVLRSSPFLRDNYTAAIQQLTNPDKNFTRLNIIYFAREIISNLQVNFDPDYLYQANQEGDAVKVPVNALEGGYWCAPDHCGSPFVCWQFRALGLESEVIRYTLDRQTRTVHEKHYEMVVMESGEGRYTFCLMPQQVVMALIRQEPLDGSQSRDGAIRFEQDDEGRVQRLELTYDSPAGEEYPQVLERMQGAAAARVERELSAPDWRRVQVGPRVRYLASEMVLTSRYLYVERTSEPLTGTTEGRRRITGWYRLPLERLPLSSPELPRMTRVESEGRRYLFFITMNLPFEVTDAAACRACGVELCDDIVIESLIPEEA